MLQNSAILDNESYKKEDGGGGKYGFDQVKESLADILSCDADKIELDTDLVRDLGVDSIDTVELIMAVEDTYDIKISDKDAEDLKTVGDVVEFIEDHLED